MNKKKDFYLVEELANSLRVSNMTIYRYIKASKLNAYKIGKEFRISKEEFKNFLIKYKFIPKKKYGK
jgi:excisionase family DNA binding protein